MSAAPNGPTPQRQVTMNDVLAARAALEKRYRSGASWFFIIAGFSIVNSVFVLANIKRTFVIGLGITQVVDAIMAKVAEGLQGSGPAVAKGIGLAVNVGIAGGFALLGVLAFKRMRWAVIVGMIPYAFDALLFLLVKDWLSIGFHALALFGLWSGLKAAKRLDELDQALCEYQQAAALTPAPPCPDAPGTGDIQNGR